MTVRLAIDTTGVGGSVVVARGGRILAEIVHDAARGYAEHVFDLLDEALGAARIGRADIDEFAVVSGPGSFTGLRIGVTTAKILAHALGRPLWAAPTLGLLATGSPGPGVAVAPAGGGYAWLLRFGEPATVTASGVVERVPLESIDDESGHVVAVDPAILAALHDREALTRRVIATDSLCRLLVRAREAAHPLVTRVDVVAFVPEYVTPSQAERAHGLDLRDEVARPIEPRGWGEEA